MTSKVSYQVMWNRLISIVEEQAQALVRTAFSTSVREAGDLSAGVYNESGEMLAQAVTGTPGHVNAMADSVAHFIRRIQKKNMMEGDIYITNDPWEGTGHLHDITVVTPSFYKKELIGFFACTAHIVDIGGRGFGADANSVYEEGLYLPIMKFADQGEVNQTLLTIVRGNVREPDQVVGDIFALGTCNEIGHRRLIEMMNEFGLGDLNIISKFIFEHSMKATIEKINALPMVTKRGSMKIDGYDKFIDLKVKVSIVKNRILCDFEGTSAVDKKGINVPLVYTKAYACYAIKCAIAPDIPNNAASLEPFEILAPEGCILNAKHPAPVALRHVIGHLIPDTVYAALDKIIPNTVPAEGAGSLCNFQVSLRPSSTYNSLYKAQRAEVLMFNSGGSGARPTLDGMNATAFPSGVMTMPIEATEHTGPIIIWKKELRPDSGGVGKFRGGLGQLITIGAYEGYEFDVSLMFDRVHNPPLGRKGGLPGGATVVTKDDGSKLRGKGIQFVEEGRVVEMSLPGGAGYGAPKDRLRALVLRDVILGYISIQSAKEHFNLTVSEITEIENAIRTGVII
ncbi:MAG: hydantoinase B/oxoprolinase family protein [Paracoccaceae bacterium]